MGGEPSRQPERPFRQNLDEGGKLVMSQTESGATSPMPREIDNDEIQEPGTVQIQEPGTEAIQEPGTQSMQEPGTEAAQEPGTR